MGRCPTCGHTLGADRKCPNCKGTTYKGAFMRILVFALVIGFLFSGCAVVDHAAWVTDRVCEMSPAERTALKERVDSITRPNVIRVECRQ